MNSGKILPILVLLAVLAAGVTSCAAYSPVVAAGPFGTNSDLVAVSAYFASIRDNPNELRAFFLAWPKGGDIHNHLTGAVYAEDVIDISARHRLLVDPSTGQLVANSSASGLVPVSSVYSNSTLYASLVDDWSMRDYPANTGSGRLWFFKIFGLINPATNYMGELIATIRDRAAGENVMYIETMMHARGTSAQEKEAESKVVWNDNFSVMRENLLDAGLRESCVENARILASYDATSREFASSQGKNVTVRYIYEAIRVNPKKDVYTDLVQAFETANQSPLVAGINFVGEEDTYYARTDYHLHMQMISYLHSVYPNVSIALHAGEQTPGLVPPEDLRFHVADAINTAKASRIGHGVDIMEEDASGYTLSDMAEQDIPIEILLTSNEQILHVNGPNHPVSIYLSHHVPVVIATDDPGIERTDLTEQYVKLALQHPELSYEQICEINLNSIRYSFLPGPEKERMLEQLRGNLDRFESATAARQRSTISPFFSGELLRA